MTFARQFPDWFVSHEKCILPFDNYKIIFAQRTALRKDAQNNDIMQKDLASHYLVLKMGYCDADSLMRTFQTRGTNWSFAMPSNGSENKK